MSPDIVRLVHLGRERLWARICVDHLVHDNAGDLAESLLTHAKATGRKEVYLDLGNVRRVDEYVLLHLAGLHFDLEMNGGRLWAIQVTLEVYQALNAYGITAVLRIHPNAPPRFFEAPRRRQPVACPTQ